MGLVKRYRRPETFIGKAKTAIDQQIFAIVMEDVKIIAEFAATAQSNEADTIR